MDGLIRVIAVVLIIIYVIFAIWFICQRQSVWASVLSCAGFIGGAAFLVPLILTIATVVLCLIMACIALGLIWAMFS